MRRIACFAVALSWVAVDGSASGGSKKETLDGTWKLVGFEVEGKEIDFSPLARWVIKGEKIHYGGEELARLTLDPATMPRSIDLNLVSKKRVHEGIYALDGDTLKICVNHITEGVKERPGSFTTEGKPDWRLLVFKREKPGTDELEGVSGFAGIQLRSKDKQVEVADLIKGAPAEKSGLKKDDVILKIGAADATDLRQTVDLVRQAKPRSELMIRIKRGDKEHDIKVKVGVLPFFLLDQ